MFDWMLKQFVSQPTMSKKILNSCFTTVALHSVKHLYHLSITIQNLDMVVIQGQLLYLKINSCGRSTKKIQKDNNASAVQCSWLR